MTRKVRFWLGCLTQILLLGLGIWAIHLGKVGFGIGLISATCAVFVMHRIKFKKLQELQEQGLNPYDERAEVVVGKAAYATYLSFALTTALIVLIGATFGPSIQANIYDILGLSLAALVILYTIFYYYYNQRI